MTRKSVERYDAVNFGYKNNCSANSYHDVDESVFCSAQATDHSVLYGCRSNDTEALQGFCHVRSKDMPGNRDRFVSFWFNVTSTDLDWYVMIVPFDQKLIIHVGNDVGWQFVG
jgi:hypothetical protein